MPALFSALSVPHPGDYRTTWAILIRKARWSIQYLWLCCWPAYLRMHAIRIHSLTSACCRKTWTLLIQQRFQCWNVRISPSYPKQVYRKAFCTPTGCRYVYPNPCKWPRFGTPPNCNIPAQFSNPAYACHDYLNMEIAFGQWCRCKNVWIWASGLDC